MIEYICQLYMSVLFLLLRSMQYRHRCTCHDLRALDRSLKHDGASLDLCTSVSCVKCPFPNEFSSRKTCTTGRRSSEDL